MAETIDRVQVLLHKRLTELDDERRKLELALQELGGSSGRRSGKPARRRKQTSASAEGKRKPRAAKGQRKEELLAAIGKGNGRKAAELAETLGISANQVYGITNRLEKEGLIRKTKSGFRLKKGS